MALRSDPPGDRRSADERFSLRSDPVIEAYKKDVDVKRAAGRPKDLEAIVELEAIREERRKRGL